MCGIFVAVNLNGFFDISDYKKFVSLTDMVRYRGPDASGYKTFNIKESSSPNNTFDVFLGHRRLSIIDRSDTGNQPFDDGSGCWIVFNGEIYNYVELREELINKGYDFKSKTDTEVILKIYRAYGEKGFSKLNGMWAFAIVDFPQKKIILSRDYFSIKPLYYLVTSKNEIYFSSEIKQLLPMLHKKEVNKNTMYKFLQQGLLDYNEETFFEGILKVKPKTNLIIKMDKKTIENIKYWEYKIEEMNEESALEKFREIFFDSVRIRLRSDVKVGALLSGGLDSSSIVVATDLFQKGIETFSVVAKDKRYSEEKFIDILVERKQIKNHKLYFEPEMVLKNIYKVVYHQDEPFGGLSVVAQYSILKEIKEISDVIVILSGQGGDEILMGYLKYFFFNIKELIKQKKFGDVLIQLMHSILKRTILWQFNIRLAKRYIPILNKSLNYIKINGEVEPIWKYNTLTERQMLDIDRYSVPALTHYEDRNSMAHSLEIRLPFLDPRLVNLLLSVSTTLKLKNGWTKYIIRKSLIELPDEIRWRKDKQGFIIPEERWLKEDLRGVIASHFKTSVLNEMGIIDSKLFLEAYNNFQINKGLYSYKDVSRVFIAELWAKRFFNFKCGDYTNENNQFR